MALVNVRLSPADARLAAALRADGVPLSSLVREAIRTEYARRLGVPARRAKPSAIVSEILRSLPDPPDLGPQPVDATDRHAVKAYIRAKLKPRK